MDLWAPTERSALGRTVVGLLVLLVVTVAAVAVSAGGSSAGSPADAGDRVVAADALDETSGDTSALRERGLANETRNANTASKTSVTGVIKYQARNGTMMPARQVKVQIINNALTNPVIATTTTDDNGRYSVKVDVASHETWMDFDDKLPIRVQALAKNPAVDVIAFKKNLQGGSGRTYHLSTKETLTIGQNEATVVLSATAQENRRVFQIADWALTARRYTDRAAGYTRKRVQVHYPANGLLGGDRYFSNVDKIKINTNSWTKKNTTVYHEYGHSVMGGLTGYGSFPIPKVENWIIGHQVWSETGKKYAWFEGFAEYVEASVNGDNNTDNMALEWVEWYNRSITKPDSVDGDSGQDFDGAKVEGAVASILWDITDPRNEPYDQLNASRREVFATISKNQLKSSIPKRNTKKAWNIHEFWNQFVTKDNHAALGRIYFQYGIQKPDRFEDNDKSDSAVSIDTNRTYGGQLNYGDPADYFEFNATRYQRITVTVDGLQGDANTSLVVWNWSGSAWVGGYTSKNVGPDEQVQFRAPRSGTYRIQLVDDAPGRSAGTYNLTVTTEPSTVYGDRFESNDVIANASKVSAGDDYDDLSVISFDTRDIYAVDVSKGETVEVKAEFDHSDANIDLFAYKPSSKSVASSNRIAKSRTVTDDENLSIRANGAGTYYFEVAGFGASGTVNYNLSISRHKQVRRTYEENDRIITAADIDPILGKTGRPINQSGYVVSGVRPGDPDYYAVDHGGQIAIDQIGGGDEDVKVEIVAPDGEVLESIAMYGSESGEVATGLGSGTHYVKVSSTDYVPKYNVSVRHGKAVETDRLEPNDDRDQAYPSTPEITSGVTTSGQGNVSYINLVLGKDVDRDYFAVELDKGDELTAEALYFSSGDLSMTVIGPQGTTSGTLSKGRGATSLEATHTAPETGTYYVKITNTAPPKRTEYDLKIERTKSAVNNTDDQLSVEKGETELGDVDLAPMIGGISMNDLWMLNFSVPDSGSGNCTLAETKGRSRTVSISGGQTTRVSKTYSFPLGTAVNVVPCKVKVEIRAPAKAKVNLYVTLDGSKPTKSNYQLAADAPTSNETLVIEPSDGLSSLSTEVKVLAVGYPIAGDYEVIVEIYTKD